MALTYWRELSDWMQRDPEFVRLSQHAAYPSVPIFEIAVAPKGARDFRADWIALPSHPNLLAAVATYQDTTAIRYAAIHWGRGRLSDTRTRARWGIQLAEAYRVVLNHVDRKRLGLFFNPKVYIDVGGHLRVGFLPVDEDAELPREIRAKWPKSDERGVVFSIGSVLGRLGYGDAAILDLASRCVQGARGVSLDGVVQELAAHRVEDALRTGDMLAAWESFELGAGWLALNRPVRALEYFEQAAKHGAYATLVEEGRAKAASAVSDARERTVWRSRARAAIQPELPPLTWAEAELDGLQLEARRAFSEALALYRRVSDGRENALAARARCHLRLGETGEAIDYAQRALAIDHTHGEALSILASAMLARGWHDEALRNAERLADYKPSGEAHYLRGKALFRLGRMPEARDAFEQASKLDPKLLEAQLLRREVERAIGNVRQTVGTQHAPTFDVPEQLAELRDVLISGDTHAAISALRDERYARDADAQLLLARFLSFDARHEQAIAVYDALEATSHRTAALVGKATALLELGRAGDALSIFEQLPDDADAAEGQARALEKLGRLDDAAAAYRRFIALASSGSDLRVRAAQVALDDIAARRRS